MANDWDQRSLLALSVGARLSDDGVMVKRTKAGLSWYAVYRVPVEGTAKTRVRHEHLPSVQNKTQARSVVTLRRAQKFQGTYAPSAQKKDTVASFAKRFFELKADLRTLGKYKKQFARRLLPEFGDKLLNSVTPGDVESYYKRRLSEGASRSTARSEVAALKSFFSAAQRDGKALSNPAKLVSTKTPNNARDRILTDQEIAAVFALAESRTDYVRPLIFLLYFTGRRISEAVSLRWNEIQFSHDRILFRDAKSEETQLCPMHPRLRSELSRWSAVVGETGYLFPSSVTDHLTQPLALRGLLKGIAPDITPHVFRHNLVSQLQRRGVAVNVIAQYTGHKTLAMLYRYSHANNDILTESLEAMPVPGQTPGKHPSVTPASIATTKARDARRKHRKISNNRHLVPLRP